jgi:hypothetical protein
MKQFIFYKIRNDFDLFKNKEMLYVFYDLLLRKNHSEFYKIQVENLLDFIDKKSFNKKIIEQFSNFKTFNVNVNGDFTINSQISDNFEVLCVKDNHLILNSRTKNSKFLEFISLYYPEFIIIDNNNHQISSLSLVNPLKIS